MGYMISLRGADFRVEKENAGAALVAIKTLQYDTSAMRGGSFGPGHVSEKWYSWVDNDAVERATTLIEGLYAWRWEAELDGNGDTIITGFRGEKLGQDEILFEAIAPYVVVDSYIEMQGEEGEVWRWLFVGEHCVEKYATLTWD